MDERTIKKQTMKLYTEEQVRKAINDASLYSYINGDFEFKNSEDDVVNSLTPIELPTDEEIEKYINSLPHTKHLDDGQYNDGVMVGAELAIEWYREQLRKKQ